MDFCKIFGTSAAILLNPTVICFFFDFRRYAIVSDKYDVITQLHVPFDLNICEGFKYELLAIRLHGRMLLTSQLFFNYLLLVSIISHIYFSLLRHSALDKEIAYLSCNLSKSSKTYYTKILYTFEYVKYLSRCELIDQSNAYVERIQIDQFNQRPTVCLFGFFDHKRFFSQQKKKFFKENDERTSQRFDVLSVLYLCLNPIKKDEMYHYELFFVDKTNIAKEVETLVLSDIANVDGQLINCLKSNCVTHGTIRNVTFEMGSWCF